MFLNQMERQLDTSESMEIQKKYLSWSIMPKNKFQGFGTKMLNKFKKKKKKTFYASVKKKKIPSKKINLKLGFKVVEMRTNFYFLKYSSH